MRTSPVPGIRRGILVLVAMALTAVGCASFPDTAAPFSDAPTLSAGIATVIPPGAAASDAPNPTTSSTQPDSGGGSSATLDPCLPPDLPVVAVCLDEPWGLAPLPDGSSALVGERLSGRILHVAPQQRPDLIVTVADVDATDGGGLLGIALSPYYVEDGLVYAYVTTADDARILRLSVGDAPQPIITDLPRSGVGTGGAIAFGADGFLYVAAADGTVQRFDGFGEPAGPGGVAVFATGLADPTGICPLTDGRIGVLDHRADRDAIIILAPGRDYATLRSGDTLWTYSPGSGGAIDCSLSSVALVAPSRSTAALTMIEMRGPDSFTGSPESLPQPDFGYLRTAVTGPGDLIWLTTANRAADLTDRTAGAASGDEGRPPDDRVVVLPPDAGGGDGGVD